MSCFCGKNKYHLLFLAGPYKIVRCTSCGQVRTHGGKRKRYYNKSDISVYLEKEEMFRELFRKVIFFIKKFINDGILLDIGAGVGLLVDEARKAGFEAEGFEPSKQAVAAAKKHFGIKLFNKATPYREKFDVIVINHVLEHLENPKKLLSDLSCRFLIIGVPNFGSLMAQLKKDRWQSLIPDQHRWHFKLKTLDALILSFGFKRVGLRSENHDRCLHPLWKRPVYAILDTIALLTGKAEAMLVAYEK